MSIRPKDYAHIIKSYRSQITSCIGNVICLTTEDIDFSRSRVNLAARAGQPTSCPSSAIPGSTPLLVHRRRHLFRLNVWMSKCALIMDVTSGAWAF